MSNFTGLGLGAVLTVIVGVVSGVILGCNPLFRWLTFERLAYGWKLSLVSLAMVPIIMGSAYAIIHLEDHIQDSQAEPTLNATALTCEQVSAIRTIAALRRESGICQEFEKGLALARRANMKSVHKSMIVIF